MPNWHEIKTGAREVIFEMAMPNIKLTEISSPSFAEGKLLESQGNWNEAVGHFYTLYENSESESLRARSGIELTQMLINKGRLGQAKHFLTRVRGISWSLEGSERHYVLARYHEKGAWVSDLEGNYEHAKQNLIASQNELELIPVEERGIDQEHLQSTITHFLGRAFYGLGVTNSRTEQKLSFLKKAVEVFEGEAQRLREKREQGKPEDLNEAFQHAWLARCHINMGRVDKDNFKLAQSEINTSREMFEAFVDRTPTSGALAHFHMLQGSLDFLNGSIEKARREFNDALNIRLDPDKENYPKGKAEALLGIATTYWSDGKFGYAGRYFLEAVKTYPYIALAPPTGR